MKQIVILGSTGSIGTQTLDVLRQFPARFRVVGLSAGGNMARLATQVITFKPESVAVSSLEKAEELRAALLQAGATAMPEIYVGGEGLTTLATLPHAETVVVGLVGFIGLEPTLHALKAGKQVLTANKETFVTAGHLVSPYLLQIVPLDSEHSAIFQCLQGQQGQEKAVRKLYLTASGGPFREHSVEALSTVTVAEALRHPNWTMGDKVTIDSATMMNKGLEIIEAHHLFGVSMAAIDVVVHPESIVHSAVAYADGSIIAQLGVPDMRVPLQYGLSYPERWTSLFEELHLDLATLGSLHFSPADPQRFPCLALARWAGEAGGTMPVVLNAADEMAVEAFLAGQIRFMEIPGHIDRILQRHQPEQTLAPDLETIVAVDAWTRRAFNEITAAQTV